MFDCLDCRIVQYLLELLKLFPRDLPCGDLRIDRVAGFLSTIFEAIFPIVGDERAALMGAAGFAFEKIHTQQG